MWKSWKIKGIINKNFNFMSKLKLRMPNRVNLVVAKTANSRSVVFVKDYTGRKEDIVLYSKQ